MRGMLLEAVKKDLLQGRASYIKKGRLYFDSISFNGDRVYVSYKGRDLVEWKITEDLKLGNTYTLQLDEGYMRIDII